MSPTLFSFAWAHSKRRQLILLAVTLSTLPILYVSLEAPKRIVNEAIGGGDFPIPTIVGDLSQFEYLALWCGIFLTAVTVGGLLKMQLNLMKGVLAERLLRRLRYALIERIHRFPLVHFRRTSQSELTSMVTAEAEPLGGIMGDMVAQPVFQAGQMLTILLFLFIQNVWMALAAIALIPVQAYLIPLIQRRVNRLNKERIVEVRALSETIGESVAGMEDLRANNMLRYALSRLSNRLSRIFRIRYQIYRLKFFMKFLNNFINQLTPFFFFSIGGYLVIEGELTLGALVAALAAFKDLSAPWKELLAFYNQYQDMGLRYQTLIERFDPPGMFEQRLFRPSGDGAAEIDLAGPIRFEKVSVGDGAGPTLSGLDFEIPKGAMVAVEASDATERAAFLNALTRGVAPRSGRILINGRDLAELPQDAIGRRIGAVSERPYLFNGTVGRNIVTALMAAPTRPDHWPEELREAAAEAAEDGISPDPFEVDWLDPTIAGADDQLELRQWWLRITEAMGTDAMLVNRALFAIVCSDRHPELASRVVALRPKFRDRLAAENLCEAVIRFDPSAYHPGLAVAENLLFAAATEPIHIATMAKDPEFLRILAELAEAAPLREIATDLLETMARVFDDVGPEHPLFQTIGLDPAHFKALLDWRRGGHVEEDDLDPETLLLLLPFKIAAEKFPDAFDDAFRARILEIRSSRGPELLETVRDLFTPLDEAAYAPGLTLLENAVFGKINARDGASPERIAEVVSDVLIAEGLKADAAITVSDLETGIGGSALPPIARERVGLVRALVKRPEILILNRALADHSAEQREKTRDKLRELLPEATIIILEPSFPQPHAYDLVLRIEDGRVSGAERPAEAEGGALGDLEKKIREIRHAPLFERLEMAQIRLLAFASEWVKVEAGGFFFRHQDETDGAYLIVKGHAALYWPNAKPGDAPVTELHPGRVIGDLAVILQTPRPMNMIAIEPTVALKIRDREFMTIIQNDAGVAASLLETVAGYLVHAAGERRKLIEAVEAERSATPTA